MCRLTSHSTHEFQFKIESGWKNFKGYTINILNHDVNNICNAIKISNITRFVNSDSNFFLLLFRRKV